MMKLTTLIFPVFTSSIIVLCFVRRKIAPKLSLPVSMLAVVFFLVSMLPFITQFAYKEYCPMVYGIVNSILLFVALLFFPMEMKQSCQWTLYGFLIFLAVTLPFLRYFVSHNDGLFWEMTAFVIAFIFLLFSISGIRKKNNSTQLGQAHCRMISIVSPLMIFECMMLYALSSNNILNVLPYVLFSIVLCFQFVICFNLTTKHYNMETKHEKLSSKENKTVGSSGQTTDVLTRQEELFNRILVFMEEKQPFLEYDFTMEDLAREMYTNKAYISKAINDMANCNYCKFINRYRIEYAKKIIAANPHVKVNELALMCGFHNFVSFNMAFKMFEDLTPGEYIRNLQVRNLSQN